MTKPDTKCEQCGGIGSVQVPCPDNKRGCLVYHCKPCPNGCSGGIGEEASDVTSPVVAFGWLQLWCERAGINPLKFQRIWRLSFEDKLVKRDPEEKCGFGCGKEKNHQDQCLHKECGTSHASFVKCPAPSDKKCCDKQFIRSSKEGTNHYCCPIHCCVSAAPENWEEELEKGFKPYFSEELDTWEHYFLCLRSFIRSQIHIAKVEQWEKDRNALINPKCTACKKWENGCDAHDASALSRTKPTDPKE